MRDVYKIELSGKTVAITGGYGYLGRAIVASLVSHGGRVFVLGRDESRHTNAFGTSEVGFVSCDVANSKSITHALQEVCDQSGSIDTLVNNAFYSEGQSPLSMTDEQWATGIDGTLGNVFRCIRAVIPFMIKQKEGKIINVSSMYGMIAPDFSIYNESPRFLNPPHYGAAKAGVLQLTRYYASYLGGFGIKVNAVSPGTFPSDKVMDDKAFIKKLEEKTCLKRVGKPEDLAGIFVFLASDAANYITGQNFTVDGGWTAK
jgi:NAD(P)-dependent dehydrogenase (short-subunit alcohol dehydrogenase family)